VRRCVVIAVIVALALGGCRRLVVLDPAPDGGVSDSIAPDAGDDGGVGDGGGPVQDAGAIGDAALID
jgi:hypothetical protein